MSSGDCYTEDIWRNSDDIHIYRLEYQTLVRKIREIWWWSSGWARG